MYEKLRIGYVARSLGVSAHYLRLLEWEGRIPEVDYDRVYCPSDLALLRLMGIGSRPRRLKSAEEVLAGTR